MNASPDRSMANARRQRIDPNDHRWYQRAVFYEVLVRGFQDSSGDGTGDLRGLVDKLDYLEWLGVDCLWLLPFYQSPLRDGGYDISDFFTVLPAYGDVKDAANLIDEAHRRGISGKWNAIWHSSSSPKYSTTSSGHWLASARRTRSG